MVPSLTDGPFARLADGDLFEIEMLDPETWEVPRRLSDEDRIEQTGAQGRRLARTDIQQDDDR